MTLEPAASPVIVTDRLELWRPQASDMRAAHEMVRHPDTGRYLGNAADFHDHFMRFMRNAGSWQLFGYGAFMVRERGGDGSLMGNCGIFHSVRGLGDDFDDRAEAGWILGARHTGRGYASEAMTAALEWFDRSFGQEIMCMIAQGNAPSLKLAFKLGFEPLRMADLPGGEAAHLLRRPPPR